MCISCDSKDINNRLVFSLHSLLAGNLFSLSSCFLQILYTACILWYNVKVTKIQLAYLAGLFDGEGCFTLSRRVKATGWLGFQPDIRVVTTNKAISLWTKEVLGFGYTWRKTCLSQGGYITYAYGISSCKGVKQLLELLMPYLRIKKEIAKLLYIWVSNHKPLVRGRYSKGASAIPDWELVVYNKIHHLIQNPGLFNTQ